MERHGLRILLSSPGIEDYDFLICAYLSILSKLLQTVKAHGSLRADADSLQAVHPAHPLDDALLATGDGAAATGSNGVQNYEIPDRRRHAPTTGHQIGVRHSLGK